VPGPITAATSAGCHRLLREFDATCVTSAADIIELTGWEAAPNRLPTPTGEEEDGNRIAERTSVLDAIDRRARRSSDEIARRVGMTPAQVEAQLGLFELEGQVVREDDGWRRAASRPGHG